MAMCDVRDLHQDDVQPTWDFIMKRSKEIDVTHDDDDGRWFMSMKGSGWKASFNAGFFNFKNEDPITKNSFSYVSFYPPNGGNVRFDFYVTATNHPKIIMEIAQLLIKHGAAGKNRVGYFIGGSVSGDKPIGPPNQEVRQGGSLWDFLRFWR